MTPANYVQYAALRGDNSDNLPGVPGVGVKTAAKLVNTYGDIDGVYSHLDEQTPKLRENLAACEDAVRLNVELMRLIRDVDVDVDLATLRMGEPDTEALRELFDFLEFHSLHERLVEATGIDLGPSAAATEVLEAEVTELESAAEAAAALAQLAASTDPVAMVAGWDGDELAGIAVVTDRSTADVAWIAAGSLTDEAVRAAFVELPAIASHAAKPHAARRAR